ncbi:MAG: CHAT domain-containing protein, partial [Bryobacteraceae bacterium]
SISEHAPSAEIFHFSGHGWSDGGNGGLILPATARGPRFLTSAELSGQNWRRCSLAVLSACLTASGEARGAVNNRSLVRAFLGAGARRVIAARWSVDSEATRLLMDGFYDRLARREPPAEALAGAEAAVSAVRRWKHPYYWAGFQIFENL